MTGKTTAVTLDKAKKGISLTVINLPAVKLNRN